MDTSSLYLLNCTDFYLYYRINAAGAEQRTGPVFRCLGGEYLYYPDNNTACWEPGKTPRSNVLVSDSNLLYLWFREGRDFEGPGKDRVYGGQKPLTLPGFGGEEKGPKPTAGQPLYLWIYLNFLIFSQFDKAQLRNFGTPSTDTGWMATSS